MASRTESLASLQQPFDLLIIGGGATGLGIAVDAATRGYRTVLVEAGDFAQATSSRSTKLVHGGVRYLANGQIALVYEALHERKILLNNAPHLVHPLPFVTPAYRWWELPWYGAGLKLYDLLSTGASLGPTRILSRRETLARLPNLAPTGLKGSVLYHDGQFDDARLALALARTAQDHGATVLNYTRCTGLLKDNGKLTGAIVEDTETGATFSIHANAVINATGIFVDAIRHQDSPDLPPLLSLSRGTHLVVDRDFLHPASDGSPAAIMVPKTPDGRVIFAIPWLGKTVIGTTDLPAPHVAIEPGHDPAEINFLLDTINPYLARPVSLPDIRSIFSGLRPLVTGAAATTAGLSREHHLEISPSGLVTIAGGKWTTYRRMAEQTLDFAIAHHLLRSRPCVSCSVRLHAAPEPGQGSADGPLSRYGTDAPTIGALIAADANLAAPLDSALPYILAEVVFAVRHEMARTVEDVLSRRTRALLLDGRAAQRSAPPVAEILATELDRPPSWISNQVEAFTSLAQRFYLGPA